MKVNFIERISTDMPDIYQARELFNIAFTAVQHIGIGHSIVFEDQRYEIVDIVHDFERGTQFNNFRIRQICTNVFVELR